MHITINMLWLCGVCRHPEGHLQWHRAGAERADHQRVQSRVCGKLQHQGQPRGKPATDRADRSCVAAWLLHTRLGLNVRVSGCAPRWVCRLGGRHRSYGLMPGITGCTGSLCCRWCSVVMKWPVPIPASPARAGSHKSVIADDSELQVCRVMHGNYSPSCTHALQQVPHASEGSESDRVILKLPARLLRAAPKCARAVLLIPGRPPLRSHSWLDDSAHAMHPHTS